MSGYESAAPSISDKKLTLLYSNYSSACVNLAQKFPPEIMELIKKIPVDHADIRKMLMQATKVKVNNLPCILEHHKDGLVLVYEGEKCWKFLEDLQKFLNAKTRKQLPGMKMIEPIGEANTEPEEAPLSGLQLEHKRINLEYRQPDLSRGARDERRRPFSGLTSENFDVDYEEPPTPPPTQADTYSPPPPIERTAKKPLRVTPLDDDYISDSPSVADALEDDPSGMGIERQDTIPIEKPGSKRKPSAQVVPKRDLASQKSKAIKNLASTIASAREAEEKAYENQRRGVGKEQRKMAVAQ